MRQSVLVGCGESRFLEPRLVSLCERIEFIESGTVTVDDLESELSKLVPSQIQASESELLYRCGWAAAFQAQQDQPTVQLRRPVSQVAWKSFSLGACVASLVVLASVFLVSESWTSADGPERNLTADVTSDASGPGLEYTLEPGTVDPPRAVEPSVDPEQFRDAVQLMANAWRAVSVLASPNATAEPIAASRQNDDGSKLDALSAASRQHWQQSSVGGAQSMVGNTSPRPVSDLRTYRQLMEASLTDGFL